EFLDRGSHRLGVDHVLRHQTFAVGHRQTLLHGTLDAHQAHAELVLGHLPHGADAAVAQVVDIVHGAEAVADLDQGLDHVHDVFAAQHAGAGGAFAAQATVELHAADGREVVAVQGEEQVLEKVFCAFFRRRFAGAHHAVDLDQRVHPGGGGVDAQGVGDERTAVEVVGVDRLELLHTLFLQGLQDFLGHQGVGREQDLAGVLVDDVTRQGIAQDEFGGHLEAAQLSLLHLADVARSDALAGSNDRLALGLDLEVQYLAAQTCGHQFEGVGAALVDEVLVVVVEHPQDCLGAVIQRAEENRGRELGTAVDTHVHEVLGIELNVEPGTAVRNDTGGVQQLAGAVGLALVVVEEHAGGAVQLAYYHTLGTV